MQSHFKDKPETRLYAIMPARAIQDDELGHTALRVLGALCLHANKYGICWPSRTTLGRHVSRSNGTISRHFATLVKKGYLRRLQGKNYPVPRRQPGRWYTSRFQVLYEGPGTPMPTMEQFKAIKPRVVAELDEDVSHLVTNKREGVRGNEARSLASAFCSGVAAASGQHRIADQQLDGAAKLEGQGISPAALRDYAEQMSLEALSQGRTPPLSIRQVAKWAGLL